jgi:AI-2 transport protein TqsA
VTPSENGLTLIFKVIMILAGIVIIIQAMIVSKAILIPLMMSTVIAIVCIGPSQWLRDRGVPFWLATTIIILTLFLICFASLLLIESSIVGFKTNLPGYSEKFKDLADHLTVYAGSKGMHLDGQFFAHILKPEFVMKYASVFFQGLSSLLTNGFFVLLTVVFILAESGGFAGKIRRLPGNTEKRLMLLKKFSQGVQEYMLIKSLVSFLTGALITTSLLLLGVDYALLWGMLAFGFNFVPNIGSIIAAVPAVLLTLIQLGPISAGLVALSYLVVNIVVGNLIEPQFMGKKLGLSTLVVFLSLVFWGWVLGPVGMLLSVILTMTLKIALDNHESTRWLGTLLGPNPEEKPSN